MIIIYTSIIKWSDTLPLHSMHMLSWLQLSETVSSSAASQLFVDPICYPTGLANPHKMMWTPPSENEFSIKNGSSNIFKLCTTL